jgi:hypothetical protein
MTNCCMNCDHCDVKRKDTIGRVRCKKNHMFVSLDDCCYLYCHMGVKEQELLWKLKGAVDGIH